MMLPSVSVVVPTRNSGRTVEASLRSLANQDYPRDRIELIVVDAFSTDRTLQIAESFNAKILKNPLITGEAGKSAGAKLAKGEFILFMDSDNLLCSADWLLRMLEPMLNNDQVIASEALYYGYDRSHPSLVRYCALMGADDPLSVYLGFYGRYSWLTLRWTDVPLDLGEREGYVEHVIPKGRLPTMGANGFLIRAGTLKEGLGASPYLFDVDFLQNLAKERQIRVARVKVAVTHLYAFTLGQYLRKTYRRVRDYHIFRRKGMRTYQWSAVQSDRLARILFEIMLVYPLFRDAVQGYKRKQDKAWFLNWPLCLLTAMVYGVKETSSGFQILRQKQSG